MNASPRSTVCLLALLALGVAPSRAASPPAPPDGRLVLRFACLVANEDPARAHTVTPEASRELAKFLAGWDLDADREEVRQIFSLHHLTEVARQATELPPAGGITRGVYAVGEHRFAVWITATPSAAGDTMRYFAEVSRDGTPLSAPQILARLGERAILTSLAPESSVPALILVVQAERLATGLDDAQSGSRTPGGASSPQ